MKATIAVLEGDGIGPEIITEALKIIDSIGIRFGHQFNYIRTPFGASAYFQGGSAFPETSKKICDDADAILKGPAGLSVMEMHRIPVDQRPELAIQELRSRYNTFANYRPVILPKKFASLSPLRQERIANGIDILMIRELMGGIYFGERVEGIHTHGKYASDETNYSRTQIQQVAEVAFLEAIERSCPLTVVHKANMLATSRLWQEVCEEVATRYKNVELSFILVDNAACQLAINPTQFNGVMLMENLQGDILSDLAGGLIGSLGLMCSASVGPKQSYYEAVHGSAPDIAGLGIANPFSIIGSAALMLEKSFNLKNESRAILDALWSTLGKGKMTIDLAANKRLEPFSTAAFGDEVAASILQGKTN